MRRSDAKEERNRVIAHGIAVGLTSLLALATTVLLIAKQPHLLAWLFGALTWFSWTRREGLVRGLQTLLNDDEDEDALPRLPPGAVPAQVSVRTLPNNRCVIVLTIPAGNDFTTQEFVSEKMPEHIALDYVRRVKRSTLQ